MVPIHWFHQNKKRGQDDMKKCPECGAKNPDLILHCICGHYFPTKSKPTGEKNSNKIKSNYEKCPNCGLLNPGNAQQCDCGYSFEKRIIAKPQDTVVKVSDIDMPFGSMIKFMVKWAFASIPAFIIVTVIIFIVIMVLTEFLRMK